jgi:hypothetical protein
MSSPKTTTWSRHFMADRQLSADTVEKLGD